MLNPQLKPRKGLKRLLGSGLGLLLAGSLVTGCAKLVAQVLAPPAAIDSVHLALGNPSAATPDISNANNYLIVRPQYVLSYNRDKSIANWVSWQLNEDWLGQLPRSPFMPDPSLPRGWYRVTTGDYTGSGFDRGHLVPAADRNATPEDSESVFWMTNIIPQSPDNNQGPWEKLESYSRTLVRRGHTLYIIAGGAGEGGTARNGSRTRIGRNNRISVPAAIWKIVVVLNAGQTLEDIGTDTRVITVIMPNDMGIKDDDWRDYRESVDTIEAITGYDFLSTVPEEIQEFLEAKTDSR
ncbi:MAG: DNA/RNA non-specific endonuclease [Cyanobacteria bacterium J069]|nr:MAG: DNA/RNA non-specific endonuclease [Cyanobacteria bacterium J069]